MANNATPKDSGIVRCTDNIGRLVIPKEVRKKLGILPGEPVLMTFKDNKVIVEKYQETCFLCGKSNGPYYVVHGKNVCDKCRDLLVGTNLDKPDKE